MSAIKTVLSGAADYFPMLVPRPAPKFVTESGNRVYGIVAEFSETPKMYHAAEMVRYLEQRTRVKSQTHNSSGREALKSRSTRSAGRVAFGSAIVVRHGRPRRLAPRMSCARISRWTWQRGTCSPALSSAFHVRR